MSRPHRRYASVRRATLALALAAGCASAAPGPTDAVFAYASALRDARYADAYQMLSAEARRTLSAEDFERAWRAHPDEVRDAVATLDRIDPRAPITARLELDRGDALVLHYEGGQWRLDPALLEFYGQHTPRQALRSFVRALDRQRYDVLLRLAPRRIAEHLTSEQLRAAWGGREADGVQQMLARLRESLERDRPVEVVGDRATMTYGPGGHFIAQLLREDGVWKIERPE